MCMSVHVHPSVIFMFTISHHYMSVSRSVTPCPAHVFLSFFVFVCQYTCLSVTFIRTMSSICVCVSVFLRPYVCISCSQLCVHVSVCHIHVYYTSLSYIFTTVCRSTCLCVCLFSCKYITCTVVCPSVCYIRAPSSQYVSVCLAVHSSKFRLSVSLSVSSVLCLSHSYALCPSIHASMSACQSYAQHTFFCLDFFCIHMLLYHTYSYVSIYLSVTFIHTMSPICVCLSFSIPSSLCFYVMMSVYHVYNCVRLSVTLMSYTCFHINRSYQLTELFRHACQSACSSTWLSIRFLCIVAHISVLLSSFTFSTYYHHFNIRSVCSAVVSPVQSQHRRLLT